MSKKICFSSVIRDKRGGANLQHSLGSLAEMMEAYIFSPEEDYTLRYSQTSVLVPSGSSQDFEEGLNPLDQWIHTQICHNK
jgi:hypothetical protein